MKRIRVLLAIHPPLLRSLVEDLLAGRGEVTTLTAVADHEQAIGEVRAVRPDVLLTSQTAQLSRCLDLLWEIPGLRIMVIGADARVATIFELRLHQVSMADPAPTDLLHAILFPSFLPQI